MKLAYTLPLLCGLLVLWSVSVVALLSAVALVLR